VNFTAKYLEKKTILRFSDVRRHISEIPHPSITVCPELQVMVDGFIFFDIFLNQNEEFVANLTIQQ
jgi:hypothetical protein